LTGLPVSQCDGGCFKDYYRKRATEQKTRKQANPYLGSYNTQIHIC